MFKEAEHTFVSSQVAAFSQSRTVIESAEQGLLHCSTHLQLVLNADVLRDESCWTAQ
jgi:hypothetical protein